MALNFTFTGNTFNESDTQIDCNYQLFYYRQNAISPVHTTENGQYNINAGEDSHLGLEGELRDGDVVLLSFYNNDGFCTYRYIHGGAGYNIQDIKLLGSQSPTVTLYVNDNTIGSNVVASSSSSDEYQYSFSGDIMHHKSSWYGFDLFSEKVGIDAILYEFNNGGFDTTSNHSFNTFGGFEIRVKVINKMGLESIDTKVIKITKNQPSISLSNLPLAPFIGEDTIITVDTIDVDNAIVDTVYKLDGVVTESLTHSFDAISSYSFDVVTTWNDGFIDKELITNLLISTTPRPIELELTNTNTDNLYNFSCEITLGDGALIHTDYKVEYKLPFSDAFQVVYYETGTTTQEFTFLQSGTYKITATVECEYGTSDSAVNIVEYECESENLALNDDGGFEIVGNIITYYDIDMNTTASYNMYDYEDNATDTYIMAKLLDNYVGSSVSTLDKRGGSKIIDNQQIVYDIDGNESARYNLFDSEDNPTMSEIFKKVRVV